MDIEHFSTGDVPVSGGGDSALRCKKCGRLFGNGFILDTSGPIPMYRCRCGASYEKQKRSLPVSTIDEGTKKKPREKLHGRFGITIVLTPEVDRSIISMFDNGVIIVNSAHPTFAALKEKEDRENYIQNLFVVEFAKLDKRLQSIDLFSARLKELFVLVAEVPIIKMKGIKIEGEDDDEVEAIVAAVKDREKEKVQQKVNKLQELKRTLESKSHI